jgi:hypothetical protein
MKKIKYKDLKLDEVYLLKYIDDPCEKNTSVMFVVTRFQNDNAYFKCISIFNDPDADQFLADTEYQLSATCYEFVRDTVEIYKLTDNERKGKKKTLEKNN